MRNTLIRITILIVIAIVAILIVSIFIRSSTNGLTQSTADIEKNTNQTQTQSSSD